MSGPVLVPVLGDQLSPELASLANRDPADTVILMMEVWDEATYVRHHKQKIALIFSAMRHFAAELAEAGWRVDYVTLDDPDNAGSFTGEVARAIERHAPRLVSVVEPGEWRVEQAMLEWADKFPCPVEILADTRFIASRGEFAEWAEGRRELRMEFFYREMRKKTGLLMEADGRPAGGRWNYDAENREPPPGALLVPCRPKFAPDAITAEVIALVEARFGTHFGSLERFEWPVTRAQAIQAADAFIAERLSDFGPYQDAMVGARTSSTIHCYQPASTWGCSTRSICAAGRRQRGRRAARRSIRSKASSARSSAGESISAAFIGMKCPRSPRRMRWRPIARFRNSTGPATPTWPASPIAFVRRRRTRMRIISSG